MEKDGVLGTIIYLVCWPITQREVEIWGIEYLSNNGFDVQVYDLTFLLRKEAILKKPVESKIVADYIHIIKSYKELSNKLKQLDKATLFLDYIVSISNVTLNTARLFRMLKKTNIKLCSVYSGTVPIEAKTNDQVGTKIQRLINKVLDWRRVIDYMSGRVNKFLSKHADYYPLPHKLFTTIEADCIHQYINNYPIMKNRLVPINAYDYDKYLNYINSSPVLDIEPICVFLDEAATHHSDYTILGLKPLEKEGYFNSLNRLFNNIETRTGLSVIIAAHPKSKYEEMPGAYGNRKIIKGQTMELVSRCSMVVMHGSTSVSFAVLFDKPILVVKTQEMIVEGWYAESVDAMAESLGLVACNIDNIDLNAIDMDYNNWSRKKYLDYINKYIRSEVSAGLSTWEIVAREFRNMLSEECL